MTAQHVAYYLLAWFVLAVIVSLAVCAWLDRRPTYLADDIARHVRECGERAA